MTDKQVIKALECCVAKENCEEVSCEICPYCRVYDCKEVMLKNAIDLINRQKAENDRLLQKMQQLKSEAIKEFAKYMIDKSQNSIIQVSDIPDYAKEMTVVDR